MWEFESSLKDQSRAQRVDSLKAYSKPIAFNGQSCIDFAYHSPKVDSVKLCGVADARNVINETVCFRAVFGTAVVVSHKSEIWQTEQP